jgi:hypothetical protein
MPRILAARLQINDLNHVPRRKHRSASGTANAEPDNAGTWPVKTLRRRVEPGFLNETIPPADPVEIATSIFTG